MFISSATNDHFLVFSFMYKFHLYLLLRQLDPCLRYAQIVCIIFYLLKLCKYVRPFCIKFHLKNSSMFDKENMSLIACGCPFVLALLMIFFWIELKCLTLQHNDKFFFCLESSDKLIYNLLFLILILRCTLQYFFSKYLNTKLIAISSYSR